jgi:hypothetical protein
MHVFGGKGWGEALIFYLQNSVDTTCSVFASTSYLFRWLRALHWRSNRGSWPVIHEGITLILDMNGPRDFFLIFRDTLLVCALFIRTQISETGSCKDMCECDTGFDRSRSLDGGNWRSQAPFHWVWLQSDVVMTVGQIQGGMATAWTNEYKLKNSNPIVFYRSFSFWRDST